MAKKKPGRNWTKPLLIVLAVVAALIAGITALGLWVAGNEDKAFEAYNHLSRATEYSNETDGPDGFPSLESLRAAERELIKGETLLREYRRSSYLLEDEKEAVNADLELIAADRNLIKVNRAIIKDGVVSEDEYARYEKAFKSYNSALKQSNRATEDIDY